MTGDHHRKGYNEVQVMKDYATSKGVPSADFFVGIIQPETYIGGEEIPIYGDGDITND